MSPDDREGDQGDLGDLDLTAAAFSRPGQHGLSDATRMVSGNGPPSPPEAPRPTASPDTARGPAARINREHEVQVPLVPRVPLPEHQRLVEMGEAPTPFVARLRARLAVGGAISADRSFARPATERVGESRGEFEDVDRSRAAAPRLERRGGSDV